VPAVVVGPHFQFVEPDRQDALRSVLEASAPVAVHGFAGRAGDGRLDPLNKVLGRILRTTVRCIQAERGPRRASSGVLSASGTGLDLQGHYGLRRRYGGPWRASVFADDVRAFTRFGVEGGEDGMPDPLQRVGISAQRREPVQLPPAEERVNSFLGVQG
jgi:hypothetical protein